MKFGRVLCLAVLFLLVNSTASFSQLTRQWVARFNSGVKKSACAAKAMAVDDSGNVYVTGWVTRAGSGMDIATIKYSNNGQLIWSAFYAGAGAAVDKPNAISVDTAHAVYVAGSSGGSNGLDYLVIKYRITGDTAWVRRYDGTGHGEDVASALAVNVNDSLNVFVTGWSKGDTSGFDYVTLKYDSGGTKKWEKRYNGPDLGAGHGTDSALALALKTNTELYVTGTSKDTSLDYTTIRYNPATGDSVWVARYKGPGKDIARAIVLRTTNPAEVFVTGSSEGTGSGYDVVTARYDGANGSEVWNARYNGSANGDDQAYDIALNGNSRLYVTGKSLTAGSANDMLTLKYNLSGSLGWSSTYNGTANDNDEAYHVTNGGSPYVIGSSAGAGIGQDFGLVQYSGSSGNQSNEIRYNGPANLDDLGADVGTFGNNQVFVTGKGSNLDKSSDIVTIKYVDLNKMRYRSLTQDDLALAPANLKIAGTNPNGANVRDAAMLKAYPKIKFGFPGYPGGLVLGKMRTDSPLVYTWMRFDKGAAVGKFLPQTAPTLKGFDSLGGKLMVKEAKNPTTAKINSHLLGEFVALKINIGASDAEITPPTFGDLTYDDNDTGNHYNGMTLRQIVSVIDNNLTYWKKYPPVNWPILDSICSRVNRTFKGAPGSLPWASRNPLVVTGEVQIDTVPFLGPAIQPLENPLSFPPGSIADEEPKSYELYQNYPNPFNPSTTIEFDLPEPAVATLKIYDVLGREVATLFDNLQFDEGNHDVTFEAGGLSTGVYFYRIILNGGERQLMKKMLLLK